MKPNNSPPKSLLGFFRWYCHPRLVDHIEGDLLEEYGARLKRSGKRKADIRFIIDVLLLFRPGIIRPREGYRNLNNYGMLKSYFKIAWRNLLRNKGYSVINMGGLALGMSIAIMIGLWINDELSFDTYHKNYDRVAQVMQHQTFNGYKGTENSIPIPLKTELKEKYGSDFKYLVMSDWLFDHTLSVGDRKITKIGSYMDTDAPKMLSLHMISGTLDGLKDQNSILLSESTAKALFGANEPVNEIVKLDTKMDVKVTGVYKDLPYNSQFRDLSFIATWQLYVSSIEWVKIAQNQWGNNSFQLFAQITDQADMESVSEKIKLTKYNKVDEMEKQVKAEVFLHPMKDWHLRSNWVAGVKTGGLIENVWLFGTIGVFVLLLACINFMNLSTARSEKRAKEVGIRKSIGSQKVHLVSQFLSESFLVVILSFVVALAIIFISLPWFNHLADKRIPLPTTNFVFWLSSLVFIVVVGLLAGSYPAFYLSSFQPVSVLRGTFRGGHIGSIPRKILVVLQFTVSITLIIGTLIVYQQIQYSKNRPIGYDRHKIMMVRMRSPHYGKYSILRDELKRVDAIEEMAESSSPLTAVWSNDGGFNWEGKDPTLLAEFATIKVTHEFGKTVGWTLIEGRDFSREFSTDSSGLIINEAAVKFMQLKDPIGKVIHWGDDVRGKNFKIIGVVKDLLMDSPFKAVKQTIYLINYENVNWIEFKLNQNASVGESIIKIEDTFKKYFPDLPFDYKFADVEHAKKFESEEHVSMLSGIFSALAIFISCLGLFGLASFVAEQRTKEIGVRKVLGASVLALWKMLSRDFVLLVSISALIAIPTAYYFMNNWLQKYEYRTKIEWWVFAVVVVAALAITLLTVSYQSIRAAVANPVNSLRSE